MTLCLRQQRLLKLLFPRQNPSLKREATIPGTIEGSGKSIFIPTRNRRQGIALSSEIKKTIFFLNFRISIADPYRYFVSIEAMKF